MIEDKAKFIRVELDDPTCCKALSRNGPCNIQATPGSAYCRLHGGSEGVIERKAVRNYRLNVYQRRVNDFADNDQVKSLREEVGILRMLLEETINKCTNETELLIYSNKISDLVMKVEKVVASCHKLELATGNLLDKNTIMMLGDIIINIIGEVVPAAQMESVSERIMSSIINVNQVASEPTPSVSPGNGITNLGRLESGSYHDAEPVG
jgi:hypothetical protein